MAILTRAKALEKIIKLKAAGRKVVFTNGCFDILHRGHTTYLKAAKALGDFLIVGLNSDESVKQLKGPNRPVNPQADRGEVLLALNSVDAVVIFNEETPQQLISELLPNILVKGGDYTHSQIAGAAEVEGRGGKVIVLPFIEGYSTTKILQKQAKKA